MPKVSRFHPRFVSHGFTGLGASAGNHFCDTLIVGHAFLLVKLGGVTAFSRLWPRISVRGFTAEGAEIAEESRMFRRHEVVPDTGLVVDDMDLGFLTPLRFVRNDRCRCNARGSESGNPESGTPIWRLGMTPNRAAVMIS